MGTTYWVNRNEKDQEFIVLEKVESARIDVEDQCSIIVQFSNHTRKIEFDTPERALDILASISEWIDELETAYGE